MKKPENVENDKNKVESSRELTDTELDAVAGGCDSISETILSVKEPLRAGDFQILRLNGIPFPVE